MASLPVRRLPALGHQRSLLVPGRGCLHHCLTRGDTEGRRKLHGLGTLPFFGFVPSPCVGPSVMWEPRPCNCLQQSMQQSTGGAAPPQNRNSPPTQDISKIHIMQLKCASRCIASRQKKKDFGFRSNSEIDLNPKSFCASTPPCCQL